MGFNYVELIEEEGVYYQGYLNKDCVKEGPAIFGNLMFGSIYHGEFKDGKANGFGHITSKRPIDEEYFGTFNHGLKDGYGTHTTISDTY